MVSKDERDIVAVLADNLRRLKSAHAGTSLGTNLGIAKAAGVSTPTVIAALERRNALGINKVDCLARAFGLPAWMLLMPAMPLRTAEPERPPVLPPVRAKSAWELEQPIGIEERAAAEAHPRSSRRRSRSHPTGPKQGARKPAVAKK